MTFDGWEESLYHSGTKGMTWGIRLYQYKDGSLTPLGKLRYLKRSGGLTKAGRKTLYKQTLKGNVSEELTAARNREIQAEENRKSAKRLLKEKRQASLVDKGLSSAIRKQAHAMDEEQLKAAINKLNLEKQYSQLLKEQNKSILSIGADIVEQGIKNFGPKAIEGLLTIGINKAFKGVVVKYPEGYAQDQKDRSAKDQPDKNKQDSNKSDDKSNNQPKANSTPNNQSKPSNQPKKQKKSKEQAKNQKKNASALNIIARRNMSPSEQAALAKTLRDQEREWRLAKLGHRINNKRQLDRFRHSVSFDSWESFIG